MRAFIITTLILLSTNLLAQNITRFGSQVDVLVYLNNKSDFTNKDTGVTLTFFEMGGRMKSNKGVSYYNPDVTLLSSTRAVVTYESLTSGGIAKIIVDCKENVIADKSSMTIYSADNYSNESINQQPETNWSNKQERQAQAKKPNKPNYFIINGVTNIPKSFVGKFIQGKNYIIISSTSATSGKIDVSYYGKKYTAPFNPNNYMNSDYIEFYNSIVTFKVFGIDNKTSKIKEIDLRINYSGDNWNTDSDDVAKKIRFKRQ